MDTAKVRINCFMCIWMLFNVIKVFQIHMKCFKQILQKPYWAVYETEQQTMYKFYRWNLKNRWNLKMFCFLQTKCNITKKRHTDVEKYNK